MFISVLSHSLHNSTPIRNTTLHYRSSRGSSKKRYSISWYKSPSYENTWGQQSKLAYLVSLGQLSLTKMKFKSRGIWKLQNWEILCIFNVILVLFGLICNSGYYNIMIPTLQLNDTTELISFDWMNNWICLPSVELSFFTADIWTGDGGKSAGVAILINYVCIPARKFCHCACRLIFMAT